MNRSAAASAEWNAHSRSCITAGVLAGGRATRMGGVNKGLVELHGRPMVEYVLDVLRVQAGHLLISANRDIEQYARYGVPVVPDLQAGFPGPLAGVASLMATAPTEWLLIAPCDAPQVRVDLGPRLWRAVIAAGADIGVAHNGVRLEPTFALLRCALRPALEAHLVSGGRKVEHWYQSQRMVAVDFADCVECFVNVNTFVQRDALAARLEAPHSSDGA